MINMASPVKDTKTSSKNLGYTAESAFQYDKKRFSTDSGQLTDALEKSVLAHATKHLAIDSNILEVGCGTARFSEFLSSKPFNIIASEPSLDMLQCAQEKCHALKNISFKQAEGKHLPFDNSAFDFVFAIRVLNQTGSCEYALDTVREMSRVTKVGGKVLIEFPNKKRPLPRAKDQIRFSYKEIQQFAKENSLRPLWGKGTLLFPQSALDRLPKVLLPLFKVFEQMMCVALWKYASRNFVLMEKVA
jgi:ubiquinone/menaquinone biosynthesis C-methylase UbiE